MLTSRGFGLSVKLLLILLAFGVIPLGVSMVIGYSVSRSLIIDQSERALRELTARQAAHLTTELTRQHLLLRTIIGQLPAEDELAKRPSDSLTALLRQSLPQDGVFDGLRIVDEEGRILAAVELGPTATMWPAEAPAGDWTQRSTVVHWIGDRAIAYLLAHPIRERAPRLWLEGHVRAANFSRLFDIPEHMAGSIEPAIFGSTGQPILIGHEHARVGLVAAFRQRGGDSLAVAHATVEGRPSLVATAPILRSDWYFTAALPIEVALASLAALKDKAVVGTVILVILIVVIGVLAARSVTTPLRELAGTARHFGKAGVYERLEPRSSDEVGLLVRAFNRMAADLETSRREIERLHQREMERAEQLATVGELASGVAHEIRNPLTGLRGALELVLRRLSRSDESRPLLEEADRQLERIEDTATQLLQYARPPELREVVVDVSHVVDRAAHVVEARARKAGTEIQIHPSSEDAPVAIDPELMIQVLVNLMLNGIDAMDGDGSLRVQTQRTGDRVSIVLSDSGPGIAPEIRSHIFRPFFTTKHQGTGLGLSISYQIITRHGGTLHVEDTPGGGATFVIGLQVAEE